MALAAGLTLGQGAPAFAEGTAAPSSTTSAVPSGSGAAQPSETPVAEQPKADEPKAEAATDEPTAQPTADAPKANEPKADVPKAEEPKPEAHKPEAHKLEAPKVEAPKVEEAGAPRIEAAKPSTPTPPNARTSAKVAAPSARVTRLADDASPLSVTLAAAAVDVNGNGKQDVGDALDVTATVHVAGASDITALAVVPSSTDGSTPPRPAFSCPVSSAAPGTDVACTARHDVTQADVDAGRVTIVVTATGTVVATGQSTTSAPASLESRVTGQGSLALTQTIPQRSDADHDGRLDAGDLVDVRLTVTNTGTLTLTKLAVSDALLARLHVVLTCASSELAPGESTTCTSERFAVTRAQATARVLRNQATASAQTLAGRTVKSATSTASVVVQAPAKPTTRPSRPTSPKPSTSTAVARLRITQWVASVNDRDNDGRLDAGDTITFGFRASNTGSLTIHGLRVVDRRLSRAGVSVHCPVTTLAASASVVCMSGPVAVRRGQAQKGFGRNFAYVTGQTAAGASVRSNSSVTDVGRTTQSAQAAALPRTGSDLADPALLGLVLLLCGATMTVLSRRPVRPRA